MCSQSGGSVLCFGDTCDRTFAYPWDKNRVCNLSGAYVGRYAAWEKVAPYLYYPDSVRGAQYTGDSFEVIPGMAVSSIFINVVVVEGNLGKGSLRTCRVRLACVSAAVPGGAAA